MDMQTKILYKELTMKRSQFNGWLSQWPKWKDWWTSETDAEPPDRPEKTPAAMKKRRPR